MDTRMRKTCHICGKSNLLQLYNHLTQMHGWNSEMRKEYKRVQKGAGMGEVNDSSTLTEIQDYRDEISSMGEPNDDLFSKVSETDDDNDEEDVEDSEEEMEDEQESIDDDDFCSDDEESSDIWDKFRREVTKAYKEEKIQKFNELKEKYPNAPSRELKELVIEQYKDTWIEEAAAHLKDIITYYEKFQETSGFFDKIMHMREQLAKTEDEEEALDMAINLYKRKLGGLFSCGSFDIPK